MAFSGSSSEHRFTHPGQAPTGQRLRMSLPCWGLTAQVHVRGLSKGGTPDIQGTSAQSSCVLGHFLLSPCPAGSGTRTVCPESPVTLDVTGLGSHRPFFLSLHPETDLPRGEGSLSHSHPVGIKAPQSRRQKDHSAAVIPHLPRTSKLPNPAGTASCLKTRTLTSPHLAMEPLKHAPQSPGGGQQVLCSVRRF